jgi:hypothetical protein
MRFSAIAVAFVALAAQVTPISGQELLSCLLEVDPCMEIVVADTCANGSVTYCLQPKSPYPTVSHDGCKDTYSHMNVYVDGEGVVLTDNDLGTGGYATCTDGPPDPPGSDMCEYSSQGKKSCDLLDGFDLNPPFVDRKNIGKKCGPTRKGLCVTVPINASGEHAQVIFAVKDQAGCEDGVVGPGRWECNDPAGGNSCSCSGPQAACVSEAIIDCTPDCGNGVVDPDEDCDEGTNNGELGSGCSDKCECVKDGGGGCEGDPHFKTWRGQHFDYHGECDLVLLHSSAFESGLGLDVHIRTKLRRDMSYISSAALRIGTDVLEVESQGVYYLNGVAGAALPDEFSGFAFSHTQPTDKQHVFEVHLGGNEGIKMKTYKDFVSVLIEQGQSKNFRDSVGLMGDFGRGRMVARDGKTVIEDANAFGQEWQVLHTEPRLFQTVRFPQHPSICTMPPPMQASQLRRRLSEASSVDEVAAENACAHWGEGKDDCVFDVLTTGDLEMAVVGAY